MFKATYKSIPLLLGSRGFFRLSIGTKPSFGIFWMDKAHFDKIPSLLTAGDLVLDDGRNLLEAMTLKNIYLIRTRVVLSAYSASPQNNVPNNIYECLFADERVLWHNKEGLADYNTYDPSRSNNGSDDFQLNNLNSGSEWTFQEIIDAIEAILGVDLGTVPSITRNPRQILAKQRPLDDVLQLLLNEMNCYLTVTMNTLTGLVYKILQLGSADLDADKAWITNHEKYRIKGASEIVVNPITRPGTVEPYASPDETLAGTRVEAHGTASYSGGVGTYSDLMPYAELMDDGSSSLNSSVLDTIGDAIAAEEVQFTNTWRDLTYGGINQCGTNSAIQEVTWKLNQHTATTRIRSFRPVKPKVEEPPNSLFSYGRYPLPPFDKTAQFVSCCMVEDDGGTGTPDEATMVNSNISTGGSPRTPEDGYKQVVVCKLDHKVTLNIGGTLVLPLYCQDALTGPSVDLGPPITYGLAPGFAAWRKDTTAGATVLTGLYHWAYYAIVDPFDTDTLDWAGWEALGTVLWGGSTPDTANQPFVSCGASLGAADLLAWTATNAYFGAWSAYVTHSPMEIYGFAVVARWWTCSTATVDRVDATHTVAWESGFLRPDWT